MTSKIEKDCLKIGTVLYKIKNELWKNYDERRKHPTSNEDLLLSHLTNLQVSIITLESCLMNKSNTTTNDLLYFLNDFFHYNSLVVDCLEDMGISAEKLFKQG